MCTWNCTSNVHDASEKCIQTGRRKGKIMEMTQTHIHNDDCITLS